MCWGMQRRGTYHEGNRIGSRSQGGGGDGGRDVSMECRGRKQARTKAGTAARKGEGVDTNL